MKNIYSFLFFSLPLILFPTTSVAQWQEWSAATLNKVVTENCTWKNSKVAHFQGSTGSVCVTYTTNASIAFPYNYPGTSLSGTTYFYMPILNLRETHANDTITVQFMVNSTVSATWKMVTRRRGWNVLKVVQRNSNVVSLKNYNYDICSQQGTIPSAPTHIKITMPKGEGELYIGKLVLCTEAEWKSKGFLVSDSMEEPIPNTDYTLPSTPSRVTPEQLAELEMMATRVDECYNVGPESFVASLPQNTMAGLFSRYESYNISRKENGVINGNHLLMMEAATDYNSYRAQYGKLLLEVAVAYRNTQSVPNKSTLLTIYNDLYDYAIFVGGMFDSWEGGTNFVPSLFLMRDELIKTNRINDEVIDDVKMTMGYNRIYMPYSYFVKNYPHAENRPYRNGEVGEDIDYMRLASIKMIPITLLYSNKAEQVRDLKAISNYYNNIVFVYSPGILDGFKPDGTVNHHWGWIDGYGLLGLEKASQIIYMLSHTPYKIGEYGHRLIIEQLKSQDMRSLYNISAVTLTGKGGEIYSYGGNTQTKIERYACMALAGSCDGLAKIDPDMAGTFLRTWQHQQLSTTQPYVPTVLEIRTQAALTSANLEPNKMPDGFKPYGIGAAFIHRGEKWISSFKAQSRYQYARESSDPFITYFGYGMLEINNSTWLRSGVLKLQSDFGTPGYDWRLLPATTTVRFKDIQKMVNKEYKRFWPNTTFVGGVEQDGTGLFTHTILGSSRNGLGSMKANKSYFCFGDYIVCVGSNISNTIAETTVTTLFQDAISATEKTFVNNESGITTIPYAFNESLASPSWFINSHNIGYWVPTGTTVAVERKSQTNPDWNNKSSVTGNFATAIIDHGVSPAAASYWYVTCMQQDATTMKQFNAEMNSVAPAFRLLNNDASLHAVESSKHRSYALAVIDAKEDINVKDVVRVDKSCLLMVKNTTNLTKTISIAYPDLDYLDNKRYGTNDFWGYSVPNEVNVTLKGKWYVNNDANVRCEYVDDNTVLGFILKDGLTSHISISNTPASEDLIPMQSYVKIFPTHIQVLTSQLTDEYDSVHIIDGLGRQVYNNSLQKPSFVIDINNYAPGMYILQLTGKRQAESLKFIKN